MNLISLMIVLATGPAQGAVPPGTVVTGTDLQVALEAARRENPDAGMTVARVETTETTRVNLIHRTIPQNAIVHATGWEVHHITAGRATAVTGGAVERSTGPAGERVATIIGGERREVTVGDVIIIPPGTPHWYPEIDGSVTYLEIRYDPGSD